MSENFNILDHVETVEGTVSDYNILAKYHYQRKISVPFTKIFKIVGSGSYRHDWPDPMSVICFMQPVPDCAARTTATSGYFKQFLDTSDRMKQINKNVLYLARLITDPRFLRKGLATKLVRESLDQIETPIVETLTPIDFTNSMYQKLGFDTYLVPSSERFKRIVSAFLSIGIVLEETTNPSVIDNRLDLLPQSLSDYIENEIRLFLSGFRNASRFVPGRERTDFILSKVPPPQVYLIWFNPRSDQAQKIRHFQGKSQSTPL